MLILNHIPAGEILKKVCELIKIYFYNILKIKEPSTLVDGSFQHLIKTNTNICNVI